MTEETKKLIESVTIFTQHGVTCSGWLTLWVNRSDFDRVVEELTKWNKVEEVGYPPIGSEVIVKRDIESQQKYITIWDEEENFYADWNAVIEWKYI